MDLNQKASQGCWHFPFNPRRPRLIGIPSLRGRLWSRSRRRQEGEQGG